MSCYFRWQPTCIAPAARVTLTVAAWFIASLLNDFYGILGRTFPVQTLPGGCALSEHLV